MQQLPSADAQRILIVDDSLKARLLIETMLRAQGYKDLTSVDSARQAFLALSLETQPGAEPPGFDLILMDLLMPEIDGIQACHEIKSNPRFLDVPIIMVTAEESTESLKEAFDAGAIDYVNKPVNRVELTARVKSALRLKHETDRRKAREFELLELTEQLRKWSVVDGLTEIANRRNFDEELTRIWRCAQRVWDAQLNKPFRMQSFLESIEDHLEAREVIPVPPDIERLVPGYLESRKAEVRVLETALAGGDYETIRVMGHHLRGSGTPYGFAALSQIGKGLEAAARSQLADEIRRQIAALGDYLARVTLGS